MLSEAVALSATVPETVPAEGAVRETDGSVVSGLRRETVTRLEVALLPDVSVATALRVYDPFRSVSVFHDAVYGADVSVEISVLP